MVPDQQRPSYTNRFGTHAPSFTAGVDWRAPFIALPQNAQDQRAAARGTGRPDTGLYFDDGLHRLELWAADANGNPLTRVGGNWVPEATFQYIRACEDATDCRLFRIDANRVLQERNHRGQWVTDPRPFNGVIYVDGRVDRFTGPSRGSAANPDTAPPFFPTTGLDGVRSVIAFSFGQREQLY